MAAQARAAKTLDCAANIVQWTNELHNDFAAWLNSQFTPMASANATALKLALSAAISGARGGIIEDLAGALGAAFGGIAGYVVGFTGAVILDPIIKATAMGIWDSVLNGIRQQGFADCAGNSAPPRFLGN
jgi:hypothetical protein